MQVLIHAGAKVDAQDKDGRTPLHFAGHWQGSDLLIDAGAKTDARAKDGGMMDGKGFTPLPWAGAAPPNPSIAPPSQGDRTALTENQDDNAVAVEPETPKNLQPGDTVSPDTRGQRRGSERDATGPVIDAGAKVDAQDKEGGRRRTTGQRRNPEPAPEKYIGPTPGKSEPPPPGAVEPETP
jgi:hypothetical protein